MGKNTKLSWEELKEAFGIKKETDTLPTAPKSYQSNIDARSVTPREEQEPLTSRADDADLWRSVGQPSRSFGGSGRPHGGQQSSFGPSRGSGFSSMSNYGQSRGDNSRGSSSSQPSQRPFTLGLKKASGKSSLSSQPQSFRSPFGGARPVNTADPILGRKVGSERKPLFASRQEEGSATRETKEDTEAPLRTAMENESAIALSDLSNGLSVGSFRESDVEPLASCIAVSISEGNFTLDDAAMKLPDAILAATIKSVLHLLRSKHGDKFVCKVCDGSKLSLLETMKIEEEDADAAGFGFLVTKKEAIAEDLFADKPTPDVVLGRLEGKDISVYGVSVAESIFKLFFDTSCSLDILEQWKPVLVTLDGFSCVQGYHQAWFCVGKVPKQSKIVFGWLHDNEVVPTSGFVQWRDATTNKDHDKRKLLIQVTMFIRDIEAMESATQESEEEEEEEAQDAQNYYKYDF